MSLDEGFVIQIRTKAEQKAEEYELLIQERHRLEQKIARLRRYISDLNNFLAAEGSATVPMDWA